MPSIEEEIADVLESARTPMGGTLLGSRAQFEHVAKALMPLLNRVRAEALREAAYDARNYGHNGCYDFSDLMALADRIEHPTDKNEGAN